MTSKVVMWELRYSPCSPNITLLSVIITQIHHQPSTAAVSEPPRSDLNGRPQHGKRSVRLIKLGEIISSTCLLAEHTNDFHCNTSVALSVTDKFPPTSWRSPKQAVHNIPLICVPLCMICNACKIECQNKDGRPPCPSLAQSVSQATRHSWTIISHTHSFPHNRVCVALSIKQQRPEHAVHARRPIRQSGFSRHHV